MSFSVRAVTRLTARLSCGLVCLLTGFFVIAGLTACNQSRLVGQEAYVFGTRVELQVWGAGETTAQAALGEVLREFDRLHRAYHAWQPSELTALNQAIADGHSTEVSPELARLIIDAQTISARGDHLFDPGIGRLIALWGFHDDEFKPVLPNQTDLTALVAARPSVADLLIEGQMVSSRNRQVALDFGGYLKGVALDRAAQILKARGIEHALINIGGNVLALGHKGERNWRVGIRHPRSEQAGGAPLATLELLDGEAIGTSGDYQRFFELADKRYCHLIDPRTGTPVAHTQALTILIPPGADAGMRSDVLTKPLFIAGDNWPAIARRLDVDQVLRVDAQGALQVSAGLLPRLHFDGPRPTLTVVP